MSSVRHALSLLPPLATTGIGSLPHTQLEQGLQMALQHDLPFLPQLPQGQPSELMIPSVLEGLPGLAADADGECRVDLDAWRAGRDAFDARLEAALGSGELAAFEPSPLACRAWRPFLFEVEARKLPFAKVQLAGPATTRWVVRLDDGRPASELAQLDQQLFHLVMAKALALAKGVRRAGATPVVFLDEPGLYALEPSRVQHLVVLKELEMLVQSLHREGALVGLHCCGNTRWPTVLGLGLDVVSLDARLSLDAALEDQGAWRAFLATGATLSLGVVPTDLASSYQLGELCDSVEASLRATAPPGVPFEALLSRMWLTPACGLGLRSVPDAERLVAQVREAQRLLLAVVQA
jgi:methionine synthase II (cobalamin-independent)